VPRRTDPIAYAHLHDARGFSPPVHRLPPSPELAGLVRRFWVPVWSLPPGAESVQRVLQYPVCLVVVAPGYARLVGVRTGLAEQRLAGTGWAVGALLQPGTGYLLLRRPVTEVTDRFVDLATVPGLDGAGLAVRVRDAMAGDPGDPRRQRAAVAAVEDALAPLAPVDAEGELIGRIVAFVEDDPAVLRVGQVCAAFGIGERALQRLCARRLGLTPKWLIQRRRLQEATAALRGGRADLAVLAADLGYTDQAHFTTDFRTVTGTTPAGFAAEGAVTGQDRTP
jgi:AraC-like DNA-binding protein